eukprot:GHVU01005749.1.p1 GENE.GHVU01005749.1~~GHVU01005749.1.p1  ORF type:complete len:163 (+),score=14.42 GHVU01005749.1:374-862(+)
MIPQGGSIGGMSGEDASSYASVPNPQAREAPPPHVPPQQQRNSSRNEAQWSESQPPSRVSTESVAQDPPEPYSGAAAYVSVAYECSNQSRGHPIPRASSHGRANSNGSTGRSGRCSSCKMLPSSLFFATRNNQSASVLRLQSLCNVLAFQRPPTTLAPHLLP